MPNTVSQKLKIKPSDVLLTLNAPAGFEKGLEGLPAGVKITSTGKDYTQIHWFVLNRAQLEKEMSRLMKLLKQDVVVWEY
jgi:hypothetical protein